MPNDHRAHDAVRAAVAQGHLAPISTQACIDCGRGAAAYHHDRGYEREHWLNVVAVCDRCHRQRHVDKGVRPPESGTITMRVSPEHEARIKAAAAADNRTVSNFLVTAALREAEEVLRRLERGRKTRQSRDADAR